MYNWNFKKTGEYELQPSRQKSYYGKAKVYDFVNEEQTRALHVLKSYETVVCAIVDEGAKSYFVRHWCDWSRTTANHVNDFLRQAGMAPMSKAEWSECWVTYPNKYISDLFEKECK